MRLRLKIKGLSLFLTSFSRNDEEGVGRQKRNDDGRVDVKEDFDDDDHDDHYLQA